MLTKVPSCPGDGRVRLSSGKEAVITLMTHEPSTDQPHPRGILARLPVPEFWASMTIMFIWLAVLFVGVFGGDMVFSAPPNVTTIPLVVGVAIFAAIGTGSVAKQGSAAERETDGTGERR